jgi:ureidoacrylate peracid hydrolase
MLTTLAEKVDPRHAALLVIDVQNDFCDETSPYTARRQNMPGVQAAVGRMETFIDAARAAGVPVIFVQTIGRAGLRTEVQEEQTLRNAPGADLTRDICQEGTWGAEFYRLVPRAGDTVFQKWRYSAFMHTTLKEMLEARGITSLLLTGVSTNVCVESTLRDAFMLNFYTVLVEDCCGYYKQHLHDATVENTRDRFGVVAGAAEIVAAWAALPAASAV